jgi:acyl carrier protein
VNRDEARTLLGTTLHQIAPGADLDAVGPDETLQEAFDLDSIDVLNLVVGLYEATGIEIPERDYPQLTTVEGCVSYLVAATAPPRARSDGQPVRQKAGHGGPPPASPTTDR